MEETIINNKKYLTAKRTAYILGCTSDYVSKLCREGKLECLRQEKLWLVEEYSALNYHQSVEIKKDQARVQLAETRAQEYKRSVEKQRIQAVQKYIKDASYLVGISVLVVAIFFGSRSQTFAWAVEKIGAPKIVASLVENVSTNFNEVKTVATNSFQNRASAVGGRYLSSINKAANQVVGMKEKYINSVEHVSRGVAMAELASEKVATNMIEKVSNPIFVTHDLLLKAEGKYISGIYNTASVISSLGNLYTRGIYAVANFFNKTGDIYVNGIYAVADKITSVGSDNFYAKNFAGYDSQNVATVTQTVNKIENKKIENKTVVMNGITEDYLERRLVSFQKSLNIPDEIQIRTRDVNGSNISVDRIYDSIGESSNDAAEDAVTGGSLSFSGINGTFTGDVTVTGALSANSLSASTLTISATSTFNGATNITGPLLADDDAGTSGYVLQTTGTGVQWVATSSLGISSGGTWGSITGTIADQTDLQSALDLKMDSFATGTASEYLKGDLTLGTFPTTTSAFLNDSGFLTSYTETDPTFTASDVAGVVTADISNWNTAFGWGDHAGAGYITGLNWNQIGGTQSDINLSGFTNDSGFVSSLSSFTTDDLTQGSTNKYSQWTTSGSDVYYNSGNVGIGTTTPLGKLHVSHAAGSEFYTADNTDGIILVNKVALKSIGLAASQNGNYGSNGSVGIKIVEGGGVATAGSILFINDGNVGLTYKDRKVGIGTTAPSAPLQLGAPAADSNIKYRSLIVQGGYSTTNQRQQNLITFGGTGTYTSDPFTDTGSESAKNWHIGVLTDTSYYNSNRFSLISNGTERLTILNAGNVGIGTTAPSYPFQVTASGRNSGFDSNASLVVAGSVVVDYNLIFNAAIGNVSNPGFRFSTDQDTGMWSPTANTLAFSTGGTERIRVNSSGYLGIGLTNPTAPLHIYNATYANIHAQTASSAGAAQISFMTPLRTVSFASADNSGSNGLAGLYDNTANAWRLSILHSNGNVGIGTSLGTEKLDVVGKIKASDVFYGPAGAVGAPTFSFTSDTNTGIYSGGADNLRLSTAGADRLIIDSSGQIGIGTSPLATSLHIRGTTAANNYTQIWGASGASGSLSTMALIKTTDASGDFVFATFLAGGSASAAPKIHFGGYNATPVNGAKITMDIANGRLGVGSTSPLAPLHIQNVGNRAINIANDQTSSWGWLRFTEYGNDAAYSYIIGDGRATGYLRFATNDLERMRIVSGGYVGIGITDPTNMLDIRGVNVTPSLSSEGMLNIATTDEQAADLGGSITLGGRVTTGNAANRMFASIEGRKSNATSGNTDGYLVIKTSASNILSERIRVTSEGNVGINTTNPQQKLHVIRHDDGAPVRFEDSNGYCEIDPTSTAWSCTSDIRLKENIASLSQTDSLDDILALNPVSFEWKTDESNAKRIGLIAQEVERIFPDLVNTDSQTGFKSVSYGSFTTYIIGAIQELSKQISELRTLVTNSTASAIGSITHIIERLTVGSAEKPAGITLFDEVTGEPYCLVVRNGQMVSRAGECSTVENIGGDLGEGDTETISTGDTESGGTTITTDDGGDTATSTDETDAVIDENNGGGSGNNTEITPPGDTTTSDSISDDTTPPPADEITDSLPTEELAPEETSAETVPEPESEPASDPAPAESAPATE